MGATTISASISTASFVTYAVTLTLSATEIGGGDLIVEEEFRLSIIQEEHRETQIPFEDRTMVMPQDTTLVVEAEDRTLIVQEEHRELVIESAAQGNTIT